MKKQVKSRASGLDFGKHIGSRYRQQKFSVPSILTNCRFWDGLLGGFPGKNPCNKNKKSHTACINPRRYNNVNVIGDSNKNRGNARGGGGFRSRRWGGDLSAFIPKLPLKIILTLTLISFIVLASALSEQDRSNLQDELFQLESNLTLQGYDWLVDYSISSPQVIVTRENSDVPLAVFDNIIGIGFNKYQILLINLSDDEPYSTFYLRSVGDVDGMHGVLVPHDVYLMKMRIDEIREVLNNYEVKNG